jgi:hypothetical protein
LSLESEYWEDRYRSGGSSGEGSVGRSREWKWSIIDSYVHNLDDVIDIGCGNLAFWESRKESLPKNFRYFGLDVSRSVIELNRTRYSGWTFSIGDASEPVLGLKGRIVLCLDVLFHIMDDAAYLRILENLARYSLEWILVFAWYKNPFDLYWRLQHLGHVKRVASSDSRHCAESHITYVKSLWALIRPTQLWKDVKFLASEPESDASYQRYRRFDDSASILEREGFTLVGKHQSPYFKSGAMYVFHKETSALKP